LRGVDSRFAKCGGRAYQPGMSGHGWGGCWPGSSSWPRWPARVLEREGQEGARLGAALRELAGGIPCLGPRM